MYELRQMNKSSTSQIGPNNFSSPLASASYFY